VIYKDYFAWGKVPARNQPNLLTISKEKSLNLLTISKEKSLNLLMASKGFLDKKQETA
jgi:hypothetical protein